MNKEEFVRIIDIPHAMETISERFDDALELMSKRAIVYGGAIRDIVAGLPIEGDLDIAVDAAAYSYVVNTFGASSRWTRIGAQHSIASMKTNKGGFTQGVQVRRAPKLIARKSMSKPVYKDPYANNKEIIGTVSFETFDSAKVQIMCVKDFCKTSSEISPNAMSLARNVDIRCCAFALDSIGRVFELIDGAYIDCKDKVLRVADIKDPARFSNLEERIEKLKARGWSSKIDLPKVKIRLKHALKKVKKVPKSKTSSNILTEPGITHHLEKVAIEVVKKYLTARERSNGSLDIHIDLKLGDVLGISIPDTMDVLRYENGIGSARLPSSRNNEVVYRLTSRVAAIKIREYFTNAVRNTSKLFATKPMAHEEVPSFHEYTTTYATMEMPAVSNNEAEEVEVASPSEYNHDYNGGNLTWSNPFPRIVGVVGENVTYDLNNENSLEMITIGEPPLSEAPVEVTEMGRPTTMLAVDTGVALEKARAIAKVQSKLYAKGGKISDAPVIENALRRRNKETSYRNIGRRDYQTHFEKYATDQEKRWPSAEDELPKGFSDKTKNKKTR